MALNCWFGPHVYTHTPCPLSQLEVVVHLYVHVSTQNPATCLTSRHEMSDFTETNQASTLQLYVKEPNNVLMWLKCFFS